VTAAVVAYCLAVYRAVAVADVHRRELVVPSNVVTGAFPSHSLTDPPPPIPSPSLQYPQPDSMHP